MRGAFLRPFLLKTGLNLRGTLLVTLASLAYLSFGLPDGMLGVAWPSISDEFGVSISSLGILILAITSGYALTTFSVGRLMQSFGPVTVVASGSVIMATGLTGYAVAPGWPVMLMSGVAVGMGIGAVDGGLNVFAALHFSARSTNWMHGFYALGASTGPAVMTGFLVGGAGWQWGFVTAAAVPLALAGAFILTRSKWRSAGSVADDAAEAEPVRQQTETLRLPLAWMGIAVFVVYTGLEVTAAQWTFTLLTESRGLSTGVAGSWVTTFFVGLAVGRIGLGGATGFVKTRHVLRISVFVAVIMAIFFWLDLAQWISVTALFTLGLAFGPIFPSLIATTPERVGRSHTPNAVGFQVAAAAVGAASMPALVGLVTDITDLEAISFSLVVGTALLFAIYEVMERTRARRIDSAGGISMRESDDSG